MRAAVVLPAILRALASTSGGQSISFGIIGGTSLTPNFPTTDIRAPVDAFGNPASRFQYLTGPRSLILGAAVEGRLSGRFSIEASVLHRPMRSIIFSPNIRLPAPPAPTQTASPPCGSGSFR